MASLLAAILSTIIAYIPSMLLGDVISQEAQIMLSTFVGLVSFVGIKWWLKRLRGD